MGVSMYVQAMDWSSVYVLVFAKYKSKLSFNLFYQLVGG